MNNDKFALITGCGEGGIGHALSVISTLLPHESAEHLLSRGVHVVRTDVTNDASVQKLKDFLQKLTGGRLDILINNAGICYTMPATDTQVLQVEKMFAVNVFGPMRVVHFLHLMLIETKGVVVNIGSIGGVCPFVYGASYNASKAALHHYGNTLRVEMRPFGVRVVNIISGEVSTNILKNDHGRNLPEGEWASKIHDLVDADFCTESVYYPMNEEFQAHLYRTPNAITPTQYAAGVVKEILKKSPTAWFWFGASAGTIRTIDALLPRTTWDWLFGRYFNLGKLANSLPKNVKLS